MKLPRLNTRRGRANVRLYNASLGDEFELMSDDDWPKGVRVPDSCWRNNRFMVQVYVENVQVTRLSICRTEINAAGDFPDKVSWDELQGIKDQLGYQEQWAVEVYPPTSDIVNVANMRHLWVLKGIVPGFGWSKRTDGGKKG